MEGAAETRRILVSAQRREAGQNQESVHIFRTHPVWLNIEGERNPKELARGSRTGSHS